MVLQIILADILLIAHITKQLVKYSRVLSVKPSNKVYIITGTMRAVIIGFLGMIAKLSDI